MSELYTVSYLRRINQTVRASSLAEAIAIACPWWNASQPPIDGNVLLGAVKGEVALKSGHDAMSGPKGKPPSGPTPGTPVIRAGDIVEARAA
jgi:hypothetical protein